jgi:hypothetical protein
MMGRCCQKSVGSAVGLEVGSSSVLRNVALGEAVQKAEAARVGDDRLLVVAVTIMDGVAGIDELQAERIKSSRQQYLTAALFLFSLS